MTALLQNKTNDHEPTSRLRILCVDDDGNFVESLRRMFRRYDVDFLTAYNGLQAYSVLTTSKPDIVITDLRMPSATGEELVAWLRGNKMVCEIPVIVVSGAITDDPSNSSNYLAADSILQKPVAETALIEQVESLVGRLPKRIKKRT